MTLDAGTLRDHIAKLDDFQEFDELARAFTLADAFPQPDVALAFFMEWPRLDRAAKLVLDKRQPWDGRHYGVLDDAAATLETDYPVAATILYRTLINDILGHAKSPTGMAPLTWPNCPNSRRRSPMHKASTAT